MTGFLGRADESGEQTGQSTGRGGDPVARPRRRGFLRASAGALSLAGLGVSGIGGAHGTQAVDTPQYADFVPADDRFSSENGAVGVVSADVPSLIEFFRVESDQQFETPPFQLEPLLQLSFLAGFEFSLFQGLGLEGVIPVAAAGGNNPGFGEIATSELVTDRLTSFGNVTVSSGSYDADGIAAAIEESELTESDVAGVFTGSNPAFGGSQQSEPVAVTWGSGYVISGPAPELVAVAEETVQGETARLSEQNEDFARQVADAGAGSFTSTGFSLEGQLQIDGSNSFVDYSALRESAVQGYTHSHVVNPGMSVWDGTSVLSYETTDAVDEEALSGMGTEAAESSLSRDGRFVTVESDYSNLLPDDGTDGGGNGGTGGDGGGNGGTGGDGGDDGAGGDGGDDGAGGDGGDDGTSGDGSGDNETGIDGGAGDDESGDNETGGDGGDDGFGPGFGPLSVLAGIGGAGYLLSRRLGDTESGDEQ